MEPEHFELVVVARDLAAEVDRLVALGAARQDGGGDGDRVVVLADPDGVEFRVSTG